MTIRRIFRDDTPTWMFRETHDKDALAPTTLRGTIIDRATWKELIRKSSIFYDQYTDEEIQAFNQQIDDERTAEEERFRDSEKEDTRTTRRAGPTAGHIYLAHSQTGHYKIGKSKTPEKRIKHFDTQMPVEVTTIHTFPADDATAAEEILHIYFSEKRIKGEWFNLSQEDVEWLCCITGYNDETFHANS